MGKLIGIIATIMLVIFILVMLFYDTGKMALVILLAVAGGIIGAILQTKNKR